MDPDWLPEHPPAGMAERTVDVMPDTVKFTSEEGQDWGVIPLNDGVTFPQYRIAGPVRFVFNPAVRQGPCVGIRQAAGMGTGLR